MLSLAAAPAKSTLALLTRGSAVVVDGGGGGGMLKPFCCSKTPLLARLLPATAALGFMYPGPATAVLCLLFAFFIGLPLTPASCGLIGMPMRMAVEGVSGSGRLLASLAAICAWAGAENIGAGGALGLARLTGLGMPPGTAAGP